MDIAQAVDDAVQRHGSLRAAARVLNVSAGYLCRLKQGKYGKPDEGLLRKLGVERVVTYRKRA